MLVAEEGAIVGKGEYGVIREETEVGSSEGVLTGV